MDYGKARNIVDDLKKYDYSANDGDYISLTEWVNGEGFDVDLNGKQRFSLTFSELNAIRYLTMVLDYEKDRFSDK